MLDNISGRTAAILCPDCLEQTQTLAGQGLFCLTNPLRGQTKLSKRTVFIVSDRTGITAEILSHSLLTQFPNVIFHTRALPFVDTPEKVVDAVREINEVADNDKARPLIFATFVSPQLFDGVRRARGFFVDLFGTFLKPLELELQSASVSMTIVRQISSSWVCRELVKPRSVCTWPFISACFAPIIH